MSRLGDRQQRWIQEKKPGAPSRSRGLDKFSALFDDSQIERSMEAASSRSLRPRVVEIGCGEGRMLLDLLRLYPHIEAHGINKQRWPAMTSQASFARAAVRFGVFQKSELGGVNLPQAWFYNAETLSFDDDSVDLVVSQVAIPYVRRKDRLIEEVWRVLKPGGRAMLHLDTRVADPPDYLRGRTPRFIIYRGDEQEDLRVRIDELRADGFLLSLREASCPTVEGRVRVTLEIEKSGVGRLPLGLEFDPKSTFKLQRLKPAGASSVVFWGCRSVYRRET